ncbi:23S rRNA (adenine(2503)-C(2))-methyltransferase RlmN [Micromonospora sp. SH-82]|uniref:23S rRNA (adenine(2503)-C(2))-methyltransferase RlmN n=1 Tax=Micromonospora sp. SH-82 TaxID=3132938 RepID=UPI003EBA5914
MSASPQVVGLPIRRRRPVAPSVFDLSFSELVERVGGERQAADIFDKLYRQRKDSAHTLKQYGQLDGLSSTLAERSRTKGSQTTKFLFELVDGNFIETVRIRRHDGYTACVSSQAGCAFACQFCASGRDGLKRHLLPGEIVQQVLALGPGVNRLVFMGIGEPLHNYDNVMGAIRILRERRGLGFKTSGITISTIGIPKSLKRLREEHIKINLTISLHATTQESRTELIPGSRNHDINEVVEGALSWAERHGRIVTFVYLLLPHVNDSDDDVTRLIQFFAGRPARINLMRWNPVLGGPLFQRVSDRRLSTVRRELDSAGVNVTVRDTQGQDIEAACGQLRLQQLAKKDTTESAGPDETSTADVAPPRRERVLATGRRDKR